MAPQLTASAADPYAGKTRRQWGLVLALAFTSLVASIDKTALSLLFDPAKQDLGLTDTQMALVYGLGFAVSNVLFTLPAGYLADRVSRRRMIAAGCAAWSLMTAACGVVRTFSQLFLARSAVGFSEAVIHPTAFSMIQGAVPAERRGRAFGVYSMSTMVGAGFGFLLGGLLLQFWTDAGVTSLPLIGEVRPWRMVMLTLGLGGLPVALVMLAVREPRRETSEAGKSGSFAEALTHIGKNWAVYVPLFAYAAAVAMQANAYGAFVAALPRRLWDLPTSQIGMTLGLMQITLSPIGFWITGFLMDKLLVRFGRKGPPMVGMMTVALTLLFSTAAPLAPNSVVYFSLIGCLFVFGGAYFAVAGNIVAMLTPQRNMGKTSAIQLFVYGFIGIGSGPAITGWVSDNVFSGPTAIAPALGLCSAVFNFTALVMITTVFLVLRRRGDA